MKGLSEKTWKIVQKMFPSEQQEEVGQFLVAECGNNLPFCESDDEDQLERIRFAVLKLSNGNFDNLLRAMEVAQQDWRDTLMAAGFGHSVIEHVKWADRYLADS